MRAARWPSSSPRRRRFRRACGGPTIPEPPSRVSLARVNSDERFDLLVAGDTQTFLLLGDGSGSFGTPDADRRGWRRSSPMRRPATSTEMDGQTSPSLSNGPNALHVLLGSASGTFGAPRDRCPVQLPVAARHGGLRRVTAGRISSSRLKSARERLPPRISCRSSSATLRERSAAPTNVPLGQTTTMSEVFAIGDINGDGDGDLAVIEYAETNSASGLRRIVLLSGNGAGGFTPQLLTNGPFSPFELAGGDVDGDGDTDLVIGNGRGLAVQLGDGQGAFAGPVLHATYAFGEIALERLRQQRTVSISPWRRRERAVSSFCSTSAANRRPISGSASLTTPTR